MINVFAPFKGEAVCDCLDAACRYKGCKILRERNRCAARVRMQGQLMPENGGTFEILADDIEAVR